MTEKRFVFVVVGDDYRGTNYDNEESLLVVHEMTGRVAGHAGHGEPHEHQIGQPLLAGLIGPHYNGERDGAVCLRYETEKARQFFSE